MLCAGLAGEGADTGAKLRGRAPAARPSSPQEQRQAIARQNRGNRNQYGPDQQDKICSSATDARLDNDMP